MATNARNRLIHDFLEIQKEPPSGIIAAPLEDSILHWRAVIIGPPGTHWEGAVFKLKIEFTDKFPTEAPLVEFQSRVFHPNIYKDGKICLDILQNKWSSAYSIASVLASIQSLLNDPNIESPANSEAAKLFQHDLDEYYERVVACVHESWEHKDVS